MTAQEADMALYCNNYQTVYPMGDDDPDRWDQQRSSALTICRLATSALTAS